MYWPDENLTSLRKSRTQYPEKVNVCTEIVNDNRLDHIIQYGKYLAMILNPRGMNKMVQFHITEAKYTIILMKYAQSVYSQERTN